MLKNVFKLASEAITASILTAMHNISNFQMQGEKPTHILDCISVVSYDIIE